MKPTITKDAFIDWYFDNDTEESEGLQLIKKLIENGSVSTTIEEVFNNAGYIPAEICENLTDEQKEDEELEFDPSEVTLID